jgi:hypothetical protein
LRAVKNLIVVSGGSDPDVKIILLGFSFESESKDSFGNKHKS